MRSDVQIDASLRCEIDGISMSIVAAERNVVVEVPDVATGLRLFQLGSARGSPRQLLLRLKELLDRTAHSLELRIDGKTQFRIGHQVGNQLWRLFRLPAMSLTPALLRSLLIRNSRR